MATVFLNGKFYTQDEARVSAFDAGFQHGVGLFETMSARIDGDGRGEIFRLEDHLQRLIESARDLGLSDELRAGPLAEATLRTVEESALERARVRLTITGGDLNLLGRRHAGTEARRHEGEARQSGAAVQPTIMIVAQPATEYPAEMFERGVGVVVADARLNPLDPMAGHKTLNYWGRLRELQAAAAKQAGEAIVFQVTNHVAGGCVSNLFVVKGGVVLTPIARGEEEGTQGQRDQGTKGVALPSPVLPGITRKWVIQWAAGRGMGVSRRMLSIDDVLGADEVFLTNSSWGVMPVVRVEKEMIGDAAVGEVAHAARQAWLADDAE